MARASAATTAPPIAYRHWMQCLAMFAPVRRISINRSLQRDPRGRSVTLGSTSPPPGRSLPRKIEGPVLVGLDLDAAHQGRRRLRAHHVAPRCQHCRRLRLTAAEHGFLLLVAHFPENVSR